VKQSPTDRVAYFGTDLMYPRQKLGAELEVAGLTTLLEPGEEPTAKVAKAEYANPVGAAGKQPPAPRPAPPLRAPPTPDQ
jgi:hypothetical protein